MLRASSLAAVTSLTRSVAPKPSAAARSRTRRRTVTRSSLVSMRTRSAGGCIFVRAVQVPPLSFAHPLFQDAQAVVHVERRRDPFQFQSEFNQRDRHRRLYADDD